MCIRDRVNASQTAAAAQFSLTADDNSHVIQLCDFSTDAGTITLRNSSYTQCGSLSLGRVTLTIGEESAFSCLLYTSIGLLAALLIAAAVFFIVWRLSLIHIFSLVDPQISSLIIIHC